MANSAIARILVPTDLSDFGKAALRWAALFHSRLGSRVTLMFANEPYFPVDVVEMAAAAPVVTPELDVRLNDEVRKYASENARDISAIDTLVVDDFPALAVVEAAKKTGADLVIMGTHGRRGLRRVLLGSVTEAVLHSIDRPLLTVPVPKAGGREAKIRKIVCPVNFTPIAKKALEQASAMGQAFDAELTLVHVSDARVEPDFAQWADPIVRQRLDYRQVVVAGEGKDVADEVLKTADQADADVVVIGAQHKTFRDATVIGRTTERVIRFAGRPVMTVVAQPGEE
jgi:nucleotide-binding universal stress UspA family protein